MPLVSVCTGTYNREDYLRECLDSVFAQTFQDFEVVIADNASTDGTVALAESYGPRVRVMRRRENSGTCSTTRNEAVRAARGTYVAFLDSDDAWLPEKLAKQVAFLDAHPDIPLCHTYARVIDEHSRPAGIRHEGGIPPTGRVVPQLLEHCFITISTTMIRRSLYDEVGPFREDPPFGKSGEDYDFFLRVAAGHPVGFLPEVLAHYRKSTAGITHGNWRATPKPLIALQAFLREPDGRYPGISRAELRQTLVRACRENARFWSGQGHPGRALWSAGVGLREAPWDPGLLAALARGLAMGVVRMGARSG